MVGTLVMDGSRLLAGISTTALALHVYLPLVIGLSVDNMSVVILFHEFSFFSVVVFVYVKSFILSSRF